MRATTWLPRGWLPLAVAPLMLFALFYAMPVLQLFWLSLSRFDPSVGIIPDFQLGNFSAFLGDGYYLGILGRTLAISFATTAVTALLSYPLAIYLLRSRGWRQTTLIIVLVLPLVTSSIVVSYGWLILLGQQGLVNQIAIALGLFDEPVHLMYT